MYAIRSYYEVVAGQVARDLAQPWQEAVGIVQAVEMLPGVEEGLLGDVLAGVGVAGDRQRDRGDGALAGGDDPAIGAAVASTGGGQRNNFV